MQPRAGRDLSRLDSVGSTGSPLSPEGFDWVRDGLGADTWLFSTSGGTDVCTAFVGGVPTLPGLPRRAAGARARREGRGVERGRALARRRGRRARDHRADAVDASLSLGRRGRLALPRELLLDVPRRLAPRRLDRDHRARHRDHHRPLRRDDQPRRRADGDERALSQRPLARRGSSTRSSSTCPRAREAACRCSSSCATAPRSTTRLEAQIRRRIREDCSPRHVPDEILAAPEIPRTLSGKILEVPVKRILTGAPADEVASRDSLANPEALDWFASLPAEQS